MKNLNDHRYVMVFVLISFFLGTAYGRPFTKLKNVGAQKCFNIHAGNDNRENGLTTIYSCARNFDQQWELIDLSTPNQTTGWMKLRSRSTGRCLRVNAGTQNREGGYPTVVSCARGQNSEQEWRFLEMGRNTLRIQNRRTQKCLDVNPQDRGREGANVKVRSCNFRSDQLWSFEGKKFRIYYQNMGLMVFPVSYKGADRQASIQQLIAHIEAEKYDVVALAEAFSDGERDHIAESLSSIYPNDNLHRMDGPDENIFLSDGGLLILSKHGFLSQHDTVFDNAVGGDYWADKGILHVRLNTFLPLANNIDLFVTHLQDDDVGGTNASIGITLEQATFVEEFAAEHTGATNAGIIVGDFNINDLNADLSRRRRAGMPHSVDLWPICKPQLDSHRRPGITFDRLFNSFTPNSQIVSLLNRRLSERNHGGDRLDYFFLYPRGRKKLACHMYVNTQQYGKRNSRNQWITRDISDHYGIVLELEKIDQ